LPWFCPHRRGLSCQTRNLSRFTLIPGNLMQRLPGLDLLRSWAIVWVMLFHSYIVGGVGEHFSWLSN